MTSIITLPANTQKILPKIWLLLAVIALGIAGCFSIFIVLLRTPILQDFIANKELFKTSLVAHVNLSVLFWMLNITSYLYSLYINPKYNLISWLALYLSFISIILLIIAPFIPASQPLMNNYIPVLQNIFFFLGLSCFLSGNLTQLILFCISFARTDLLGSLCRFMAIIHFMVYIAFMLSYMQLRQVNDLEIEQYYELLFWGGGHLLQFLYTQVMMVVWLLLYAGSVESFKLRFVKIVFWLLTANSFFAVYALYIYYKYQIMDPEHITEFTNHMIIFGGICPSILGILLSCDYYRQKAILKYNKNSLVILILSIALFGLGGVIACLISNSNVIIPAHYHGSIVAITMAFTGLVYLSLTLQTSKLALWQSIIYAAGQMVHIIGLACSGGYGELRKTTAIAVSFKAKISMMMMGIGGVIAIIGGCLFVIICLKTIIANDQSIKAKRNEYSN